MFQIQKESIVFDIGGVTVGRCSGKNPTVLIGTVFYNGHKIVEDATKGIFDRGKAEDLINRQDELSDKTGNPCLVDVVCASTEAIQKYLDFVASVTDAPIFMDGVTASINKFGLEYARDSGLIDRVIYNSLVPGSRSDEIAKFEEVGLQSAVLLALNTKDFTARGRVTAIDDLLSVTTAAGITKPLIDTCVLDLATLGQACLALVELKEKYGLPVGCAPHNATSGVAKRLETKYGKQTGETYTTSPNVIAAAVGADFILYGPIESAPYVFPAIGMVDVAYGQVILDEEQKLDRTHPRFRLLAS